MRESEPTKKSTGADIQSCTRHQMTDHDHVPVNDRFCPGRANVKAWRSDAINLNGRCVGS
jgi:hypothetical protein